MTIDKNQSALSYARQATLAARPDNLTWAHEDEIYKALQDEIIEIQEATDPDHRAEEVGDLLWVAVGLACHYGIDPEKALQVSAEKFVLRWETVKKLAALKNEKLSDLGQEALDVYWKEAKILLKG